MPYTESIEMIQSLLDPVQLAIVIVVFLRIRAMEAVLTARQTAAEESIAELKKAVSCKFTGCIREGAK